MNVQIPSNQCLRFFGSSTWLSALIIAWGIVSGLGCLISGANGYIVQVCSSCNTHTFLTYDAIFTDLFRACGFSRKECMRVLCLVLRIAEAGTCPSTLLSGHAKHHNVQCTHLQNRICQSSSCMRSA